MFEKPKEPENGGAERMCHEVRKNSYLEILYDKYGIDFFKEEIRSDFLVSTKRKQTWAVQLDLLEHFIEVCNQHNLQYYMAYGSLLGAVRHKGFVPWDDDMDVLMPREDYDKLPEYKDEFTSPIFFQTPYTDKNFAGSTTKLRNSETSFLDPTYLRRQEIMNMGIALDIFPLDKIRKEDATKIHLEIAPLTLKCAAYMKHGAVLLSNRDKFQVDQYYDPQATSTELFQKINDIACRFKGSTANYRAQCVNTIYDINRQLWPEDYFQSSVQMPFEGILVNIPKSYDECLRATYGNYMEFPPISERGKWHNRLIIRPDVPYKQAISEYLASIDDKELA